MIFIFSAALFRSLEILFFQSADLSDFLTSWYVAIFIRFFVFGSLCHFNTFQFFPISISRIFCRFNNWNIFTSHELFSRYVNFICQRWFSRKSSRFTFNFCALFFSLRAKEGFSRHEKNVWSHRKKELCEGEKSKRAREWKIYIFFVSFLCFSRRIPETENRRECDLSSQIIMKNWSTTHSSVLLYFFCVFLFCLILYNTCVNIFVILKAPGEEGSRLVPERRRRRRRERERKKERKISLNSVEQPNKNYTEYLSSMLFLFDFSFPSADQRSTTHVPHKYPCRNISDETP